MCWLDSFSRRGYWVCLVYAIAKVKKKDCERVGFCFLVVGINLCSIFIPSNFRSRFLDRGLPTLPVN